MSVFDGLLCKAHERYISITITYHEVLYKCTVPPRELVFNTPNRVNSYIDEEINTSFKPSIWQKTSLA